MGKDELKKIIFCQGNKKELEEITGEEFEYMQIEKETNTVGDRRFLTYRSLLGKDHLEETLVAGFNVFAEKLGVDAITHYAASIIQIKEKEGWYSYEGFARGTPMKKKTKETIQ